MAQVVSISLGKFTASVQAAVKAAVAKHPKFKMDVPNAVTVAYLIRGIPVPEGILSTVSMGETQAFGAAARGPAAEGAILSVGRHVIVGIPPVSQVIQLEK
jgi:hypothetical protein